MSDSEKRKFKLFFATDVIIILILLLWHFVINTHEPSEVALTVPNTNDDSSLNFDLEPKEENKNDEQSNASDAPKTSTESNTSDLPAKEDAPSFDPTPSDEPEVVRHSVTLITNDYGTIKDTTSKTSTVLIEDGKSVDVVGRDLLIGGVAYISALPDNDEYAYSAFVYDSTCGNTVTEDCEVTLKFDRMVKYYNVKIGIDNPDYADINLSLLNERVKNYTASVPYGTEVELINDNEAIKFFGRGLDFYAQTELMLNTVEYTYESTGIISNTCGTSVTENCSVTFGVNRILNEYVVTFMMEEVGNDIYTSVPKKYGETLNIDEIDAPEKDGYIFLGWIDSDDNAASGTITIDSNIQYRATWRERHSLSTISTMQEMTPLVIDDSFENETKQLIDTRDNKLYWVTKLKDGNIWMTQNLDYDIKATNNIVVKNDGTTSKWSPNTPTVTEVYQSVDNLGTNSYDPGNIAYMGTEGTEKDDVICNISENSGEDCHYHVGNYYQWNTATAGTGGAISDIEAQGSICPKGWRLPSNIESSGYSFGMLTKLYGITDGVEGSGEQARGLLVAPFYYVYGGLIADGMVLSNNGDDNYHEGYYWTASNSWNDTAYSDYYNYGDWWGVYGPDSGDRFYGLSIRCVANKVEAPEPESVVYIMQNVADWKDEIEVEEQVQVVDERDGKMYWVAKLKDGNIWMTQNLDYDIVAGDNIVSNNDGTTSIWNSSSAYAPTETATQLVAATRSLTGTYSYDNGDKGYINGASTETTGINCNTTSNSGEDCHYHMGNFYQWNAATAGTGGTITGQDAPSSICPKGWRLPIGNSYTADKSFGKLTNAYGITADNNATTDAAFIASPLYFLRGGGIDNRGNIVSLSSPSDLSSYWSSTATDTTDRAYRVYIMKDGLVSPTARYTRDHSFFIRCVANIVEAPEPEPIARTMQNVADWKDELDEEEQIQVADERDGKLYWVAKLKDGNIWMTQNLDLDLDSTVTLTPEDTNITENWTPARSTISGESNLNSTNWKKDNKTPYSFDPGDYYFDGSNYTSSNCNYLVTDCDHFATTPYELNGEHGHVGNFYNWSAAVASNDTSAMKNEGADAETSICPKGWRLPRGYQSANGNDFKNLNAAYNEDTGPDYPLIASPVFFTRSGQILYSATMNNPSNYGYYWSSTILGDTLADNFYFYSGMVYTSNYGSRASGFNIRCVANVAETPEEPEPIARTMQSVADWKDELEVEEQVQAVDERDGKMYWVAKLKDGNIWMTQNLDYDIVAGDNIVSNLDGTTSVWNTSSTYAPRTTLTGTDFKNHFGDDHAEKNETYSYDPGDYYWDGTTWLGANSNSEGFSNSFLSTAFSTAASENEGEHYHVGNYYQWNAVTAGTGDIITEDDAVSSICPKGWRIPTNDITAEAKYSFNKLVNIYNITTGSALAESPLHYVPTGCIGSTSKLYRAGYIGLYWSSKNQGINYAYSPTFQTGSIFSFDYSSRYSGLTVRCVAM